MNKQQLAQKIWQSANKMRSKIEANEYKDYILGFIFYKFLSDKETEFLVAQGMSKHEIEELSEADSKIVKYIKQNIGYFISYKDLFSTWIEKGSDFAASDVTEAISAFNRNINESHKKVFEKIFFTLETGLSKLGETSGARTKAISGLIQLIKDIPMDGRQDYDVLGFIYEYLIGNFAAHAGKKAGEFYTPHEVSLMMSEIVAAHLKDKPEIKIYDPTSGSGSLLINIGRSVGKHIADKNRIRYYAQELKENTYNLTRMNLVMRGIKPDNIVTRNADTLEEDWPMTDDGDSSRALHPLYVDAVVSNPPYSQHWDNTSKESDVRFASYGVAPKAKADYAFLLHDLCHLKPDGIMTIVLPHGVLFRSGEEAKIRRNLVENCNIEAIIGLPANIFFGTGIPTLVMVLRKRRDDSDVLFIDASRGFEKDGKSNRLRASDIKRIADAVAMRKSIPKFSRLVSRDIIRENNYNLNIPRYVSAADDAETWDLYATMKGGLPKSEIDLMGDYWMALKGLRGELFAENETPYATLKSDSLEKVITASKGVDKFSRSFRKAWDDFADLLQSRWVDDMMSVNVEQEEEFVTKEIFRRLSGIPLIDPYWAYQHFYDSWVTVSIDLEMIQTEGRDAIRRVDPNMVIRKKGNKEEEVQKGWVGHILPFDLVQKTLLSDDLSKLENEREKVIEVEGELAELIDKFDDEDKEIYLNDANDAFDKNKIEEAIERIFKENFPHERCAKDKRPERLESLDLPGSELDAKLIKAAVLLAKESAVKKRVKNMTNELHEKTKATIEGISEEDANRLVGLKWIVPLCGSLQGMDLSMFDELAKRVKLLSAKYADPLEDVERTTSKIDKGLYSILGELTGKDFDKKGLKSLRKIVSGGR